MHTIKFTLLTLMLLAVGLTGCDSNDGPMEEAGENADEAYEESKSTINDAAEEAGDALEDATDELEE